METIEIVEKNDCCGCSSCAQKCPKNAITMKENVEGFLYPEINKEKCSNCGLCFRVCPQLKKIERKEENCQKIYALYNKNEEIQIKSSSGGVFSEIAKCILNKKGVIFGASYDDKFKVKHIQIENESELDKLRKSKYVQSNINDTYIAVERELKNGKDVLFSGTPCQVFGLKSFLMKDYDNLVTCDIVCHGIPSQKSFDQYLKYLSKIMNDKIVSYDFRSKDIEGCEKIGKVTTINGKTRYLKIGLDCYYNNFLEGNIFRESCYKCHYSNMNRVGDLTIGDFIGISQMQPEAFCKRGTSICLINSEKGEKIFKEIQMYFNIYESSNEKVRKYNSNLNNPKSKPNCRSYIFNNIDDYEKYVRDLKKYMNQKSRLKSLVPIRVKNILKKLRGK